jgi:hypothetical protein
MRRSSQVLAIGLGLVLLGLGNTWMGASKVAHYARALDEAVASGGPEVARPYRGTSSLLARLTEPHLRYERALAKRRYYAIVYRGGRLVFVLGAGLLGGAFLRRLVVPIPSEAEARTSPVS